MFRHLALSSPFRLEHLTLSHVNLCSVFADKLAAVAERMERGSLVFDWTSLTAQQVTSLLQLPASKRMLKLRGVNMEGVPAHLVAKFRIRGCANIFRNTSQRQEDEED